MVRSRQEKDTGVREGEGTASQGVTEHTGCRGSLDLLVCRPKWKPRPVWMRVGTPVGPILSPEASGKPVLYDVTRARLGQVSRAEQRVLGQP